MPASTATLFKHARRVSIQKLEHHLPSPHPSLLAAREGEIALLNRCTLAYIRERVSFHVSLGNLGDQ